MNYMPGFSRHYFGSASQTFFGSTHKVRLILRDGPLEKLLRLGGGGFSNCTDFFVNIFLVGIVFFPYAGTFFLDYSLCMNFFTQFSVAWIFLYFAHPAPPPHPPITFHNFSNDPSLSRWETNIVTAYDYSQKKHLLFQSYCRSRIIT